MNTHLAYDESYRSILISKKDSYCKVYELFVQYPRALLERMKGNALKLFTTLFGSSSIPFYIRYKKIRTTKFRKTDIILDAGCGDGIWLSKLSPDVKCAIGIDIRKYDFLLSNNVQFIIADLGSIPLKNCLFDVILLVDVVEHIKEDKVLIEKLWNLLKPNGKLILSTLLKWRTKLFKKIVFEDHIREYTEKDLHSILKGHFKILNVVYFYYFFEKMSWELYYSLPPPIQFLFSPLLKLISLIPLEVGLPAGIIIEGIKCWSDTRL